MSEQMMFAIGKRAGVSGNSNFSKIFVQFSYNEYMYERDNISQLLYAGN